MNGYFDTIKCYGRDGVRITDHAEFSRLFMDFNYKVIRKTSYPEADIEVSSVWLGTDHGWGDDTAPDYRPVIFETMVFGLEGDDMQERDCTVVDTLVTHDRIVAALPKKLIGNEVPEVFEGVVPMTGGWL